MLKKFLFAVVVALSPITFAWGASSTTTAEADATIASVLRIQVDNTFLHFGTITPDTGGVLTGKDITSFPSTSTGAFYQVTNNVTVFSNDGVLDWKLEIKTATDVVGGVSLWYYSGNSTTGGSSEHSTFTKLTSATYDKAYDTSSSGGTAELNNLPDGTSIPFYYALAIDDSTASNATDYLSWDITYKVTTF